MLKYLTGFAVCYYDYHTQIKKSIFSLNYKNSSKGTCFIISKSGLALCNYHPLESDPATNKDGVLIKVIAAEKDLDLSLLQFPPNKSYIPLKITESNNLKPGEVLYHYGFAIGSLVGNKGFYQGTDGKYLYASTEMIHGQSGGPVLNESGEVVGVCKAHFYCSEKKIKECLFHSGPSMYVSSKEVIKFLENYCEFKEGEWRVKD